MGCTPSKRVPVTQDGLKKSDVRLFIHEHVGHPARRLVKRGLVGMGPKQIDKRTFFLATRSPEDIEIVVAGGKGGHSAVIIPWSLHSNIIVRSVLLADGSIPKGIEDFR